MDNFALQIDPTDMAELAAQFVAHGRLRIRKVLDEPVARALHAQLDSSPDWTRTFRQGNVERQVSPAQLAQMPPAALAAVDAIARAGAEEDFRFLHDAIRLTSGADLERLQGTVAAQLAAELNEEPALATFRALTAEPSISHVYLDATRYLPGHFLNRHNDGRKKGNRVVAFVLNLSPTWRADWGGLLQFHDDDGDISRALTPSFNTLHLFAVPQWHSVSMVALFAPIPRYSLAGWLYRD